MLKAASLVAGFALFGPLAAGQEPQASVPDPFLAGAIRAADATVKPKVLFQVLPDYVFAAGSLTGPEGELRAEFVVDARGDVRDARISKSVGPGREFEEETLRAVKGWKFEAGRLNGEAVAVIATAIVEFKMQPYGRAAGPRVALRAQLTVDGVGDEFAGAVRFGTPGLVPPRLIKEARPRYPKGETVQGIVHLEALVGTTGMVTAVRVARSVTPALDAEAVRVVKLWTFASGTLLGKAVAVRIIAQVEFRKQ